jgi:4-hydroxy-3-polyprenylbenzoate decarboxylase
LPQFYSHVLERVDWKRDIHFYTKTTIDTLDYSGSGLNTGSKVVIAAAGQAIRTLSSNVPNDFEFAEIGMPHFIMPGIYLFKVLHLQLMRMQKLKLKNLLLKLKIVE